MSELKTVDEQHATRTVPALDGIRGVAIIWVVLHNAMDMPVAPVMGLSRLVNVLVHPGWIGVQLFFALSGFLITYGLLETQGAPRYFRNFYARRALRILPLYYLVLFALLVVAPRVSSLHWPPGGQASLWLFIMNWTHEAPYGFAHFWSLAVEEQFYLLWPFVVWRLAPKPLFWVCIGVSGAALALRCLLLAADTDPWTIYTNTACRMDALALGGAGACVLRLSDWRGWARTRSGKIALGAALLFGLGIPLTHVYDRYSAVGATLGYTLLAISSAGLVLSVSLPGRVRGISAGLAWGPLRSVGRYSYAMYVFHALVHKLFGELWLMSRFGSLPPTYVVLGYALALLATSYALAFCSYHLLEKRFLKLKGVFGSRRDATI